ncbi:MAG: oligopeptide transporter, OPT family [Candidatus Macondimonas sp.]
MKPEALTVRSLALGALLAVVLGAANAYLGLYAGLTVSASIPAAVMGMGLLRLLGGRDAREVNLVQTAASSGEALAAGVIFTFPALLMIQFWPEIRPLPLTLIALGGGLLGVIFTIPLRHLLINDPALPFPEGTATAEVVRLTDSEAPGLRHLVGGALGAATYKLLQGGAGLWPVAWNGAAWWGSWLGAGGVALSPALLGVGALVGMRIAVLIFAGGALAWGIGIPLLAWNIEATSETPWILAQRLWSTRIRYVGVGAMLVGGLWSLLVLVRPLWVLLGSRASTARDTSTQGSDLPTPLLRVTAILLVGGLGAVCLWVVGNLVLAVVLALILALMGFLFSAVAGYMAGLVGSSHNPVSGMTIATILLTAVLLRLLLGADLPGGAGAVLLVGAAVCCAAALAGDNLQDLKAGALLGASPWRQQIAQIVGVVAGALVMAPVLILLEQAYGFGPADAAHPHALPAPQAGLMAALAQGVFVGDLPWGMITIGVALGAAVILLDRALVWRGSSWRVPVLAVAVGVYLPVELSAAIFLGSLLRRGTVGSTSQHDPGLLRAAGWITGEALAGIALAAWVVLGGTRLFMRPPGGEMAWIWGLSALAVLAYPLWRSVGSRST